MSLLRRLPPPELTSRARALVESDGAVRAAKALDIGRDAAVRLAAGLPVRRGTVALAERALERLDAEERTEPAVERRERPLP